MSGMHDSIENTLKLQREYLIQEDPRLVGNYAAQVSYNHWADLWNRNERSHAARKAAYKAGEISKKDFEDDVKFYNAQTIRLNEYAESINRDHGTKIPTGKVTPPMPGGR